MKKQLLFAALAFGGGLTALDARVAEAQVVGSSTTTVGVSVAELSQVALGYSVKKSLLDRPIFNDAGDKVGKVDDLVIAPDKKLTYLIVGAGGFIGIGRHDVAIPVTQVQFKDGKLLMSGATKDAIKAMPAFEYAPDTSKRDAFVERDMAEAKAKMKVLEERASQAGSGAKQKLDHQLAAIRVDLKAAEEKLGRLKHATAAEWRTLEVDTDAAMARLKKSVS